MKSILESIEPALSFARQELRRLQTGASASETASAFAAALEPVRAGRVYLDIHRTPSHVMYDPRRALKPALETDDERRLVEIEATGECPGDPEQVRLCAELVLRNAALESDAILTVELVEEDDTPQVVVEFDGPGRFVEPMTVAGFLDVPFADFEARWTAATRGGRIDRTPNGLRLRLKGVRVVPESVAGLDEPLAALRTAEQRLSQLLKLARGGSALDAQAGAALDEARAAIDAALAAAEGGNRKREPSNVCALIEEVVAEAQPALKAQGVGLETWCDRNVPPIATVRERVRASVANVLEYARHALPPGGTVNVLVDYDARERVAGMVFTLDGLKSPAREDHWMASLRRTVEELHEGTMAFESGPSNATVTVTLPDPVGRRLDEWLPGWDTFGDKSRQVLRLLKSGGPTPPEDFLLEGVLEEELESRLLPKLDSPAAVNVAHELKADNSGLSGSSAERLEKVLDQIRRRKPRRDIVRPAHAAELLWAYRADARSRSALGIGDVDDDSLRKLCAALLRKPPAYVEALRLISQVLPKQEG